MGCRARNTCEDMITPLIGSKRHNLHPHIRGSWKNWTNDWTNVAWSMGATSVYRRNMRGRNARGLLVFLAVALAVAAPAGAHDNQPPSASFSWTPATPRTGDNVNLTATTSD